MIYYLSAFQRSHCHHWLYLWKFCLHISSKWQAILNVSLWWLSWSWSHGSWIYNYLCNQCISPLKLWVRILLRWGELDTTLCDKACQWLVAGLWFSLGTPIFSTNKTDCHDITEILLKVALNTITLTT
jgi:hypothetical protein